MASPTSGGEVGKPMVTPTGAYWFGEGSALQTHVANPMQTTFEPSPSELIYNLTTGMEMIGFQPTKNLQFPSTESWQENSRFLNIDDPSLIPCVGNQRPSQGLSLSLSSSGLLQGGFLGRTANLGNYGGQFVMIRNSTYLGPAQELLREFCNLGTEQNDDQKICQWQDEGAASSAGNQSLFSIDLVELQRRKSRLVQMLEEVDRRYKKYSDQMRAVVLSFEEVAGKGAAAVYTRLASKAMSRHFRCLRDGIVKQIKATRKAMGENDTAVPGTTKGDTPGLRILDQTLRQQRAFQHMNSSLQEVHPWRPHRGLPEKSVSILRSWLFEHFLHPYPSDVDKHILARQTGLSRGQVSNWFINARVRLWKPMVEEMYVEETKAEQHENLTRSTSNLDKDSNNGIQNLNPDPVQDHKPTHQQLARTGSECISSLVQQNPRKNVCENGGDHHQDDPHYHLHHHGRQSFGVVELDFSSYGGGNNGGGVSLTLGLQQQDGGGGPGLAFSPVMTSQNSFIYTRDQIGDCQAVEYSLLGNEGQNLPYRNLPS